MENKDLSAHVMSAHRCMVSHSAMHTAQLHCLHSSYTATKHWHRTERTGKTEGLACPKIHGSSLFIDKDKRGVTLIGQDPPSGQIVPSRSDLGLWGQLFSRSLVMQPSHGWCSRLHLIFLMLPPVQFAESMCKVEHRVGGTDYGCQEELQCMRAVLLTLPNCIFIRDFFHNVKFISKITIQIKTISQLRTFIYEALYHVSNSRPAGQMWLATSFYVARGSLNGVLK